MDKEARFYLLLMLMFFVVMGLLVYMENRASAGPVPITVQERIQAIVDAPYERCDSLHGKATWADAVSVGASSVSVALGGTSLASSGNPETALRISAIVVAGVAASAAYLGREYRQQYHRECALEVLR